MLDQGAYSGPLLYVPDAAADGWIESQLADADTGGLEAFQRDLFGRNVALASSRTDSRRRRRLAAVDRRLARSGSPLYWRGRSAA